MLTPVATSNWLNKVPDVTLPFWVVKIMSTTVGETGADFLAVNAGWGKGTTQAIMGVLLAAALFTQLRTRCYPPLDLLAHRRAGERGWYADH